MRYYNKFLWLSIVFFYFTSCKTPFYQTKIKNTENLKVSTSKIDSSIVDFIIPYKKELSEKINTTLCIIPENLQKQEPECKFFNLIADACFSESQEIYQQKYTGEIDFCLLNKGGIRRQFIPKGPLKVKDVFEIMPFDNQLVVVKLSPNKIQEMIQYLAVSNGHPIANMKLQYKEKTLIKATINGLELDPQKSYNVLTSDYLLGGGDRMNFFKKSVKVQKLDVKMRDVLLNFFTKQDTVKLTLDQRFYYDK